VTAKLYPQNAIQQMLENAINQNGWTLQKASSVLGISVSYVQQVLQGAVPGDDKLVLMAKGIGIEPGQLILMARRIKGNDDVRAALEDDHLFEALKKSDATPPDWLPGKEEDEIVQMMQPLDRDKKKQIVQLVKTALGLSKE